MDNIDMKDYITQELAQFDNSIVATPRTREDLESLSLIHI